MALGGFYKTGTLSVNAAATAVTGVGTAWSVNGIMQGDFLIAAGLAMAIDSVTDDTHLVLESGWPGAVNLSGSAYVILKTSWLRYDPALALNKLSQFLNSNVFKNVRLAITGAYPVVNADKGKTIAAGGSASYAITFGTASGYDTDFAAVILNEDTALDKTIVLTGGATLTLAAGRSLIVFNQNNVWRALATGDALDNSANVAVNGAVDVSQELGTTGATLTNNTAKYIADCWEAMYNHAAATAVVTSAQLAAASFPTALSGFGFGHQIKATTAITSPANGDFAKHRSKIEGYRISHWGWGASGAAAIVVAFRLYSTAAGTAFLKLSNSDQSRCYYHEITVAAGWNFYALNVAGDTSGTWQATTSTGLTFEVFVAGKAASPASAFDAWGSTNSTQTTNSTNLLGTNNNLTILTGLLIAAGARLPGATELPSLMRNFSHELLTCMRYYFNGGTTNTSSFSYFNTGNLYGTYNHRVPMRANPTIVIRNGANNNKVITIGGGEVAADGVSTNTANGFGGITSSTSAFTNASQFNVVADARL